MSVVTGTRGTWSSSETLTWAGPATYTVEWSGDIGSLPTKAVRAVTVVGLATSLTVRADRLRYAWLSPARVTLRLGKTAKNRVVTLWMKRFDFPFTQVGRYVVRPGGTVVAPINFIDGRTWFKAKFAGDQFYSPKEATASVQAFARVVDQLQGGYATTGGFRLFHATSDPLVAAGLFPQQAACLTFQTQWLQGRQWRNGPSACFGTAANGVVGVRFGGTHTAGMSWRFRAVFRGSARSLPAAAPWLYVRFTA
jgi:hypothetical protein